MTRLFIFLFTITIAAIAAMWFIENDGSIVIEWLGYRVQTSVAFMALAGVIMLVLLTVVIQVLLWFRAVPKRFKRAAQNKKREQGLTALTQGFAAIAAEDTKRAQKLTKQAVACLGSIPLTKLLEAQTAQLEGNIELAKVHYTAMLENKQTEIIAIKGLLLQARKDGDLNKAVFLAEKAVALQPHAEWAVSILLDLYTITHRWRDAETMIQRAARLKLKTSPEARHARAIIALAQCQEYKDVRQMDEALKSARQAYKLDAGFSPVAINYATLLLAGDHKRKAAKVLETSWKHEPNPQLATLYIKIYDMESKEKQLKYAERLLSLKPSHADSHVAVARAALAAGNTGKARSHLKTALALAETRSICMLMAQVEEADRMPKDVVVQWLQRAETSNPDPAWTCSGCTAHSKHWQITCSHCGAFDSMSWGSSAPKMNIIRPGQELLTAA